VANDFLDGKGIHDQFPLYAPPTGETAGFHRANVSRALAKGLKFRPVSDTAKATLDWYKTLPSEIQARVAPQFAQRPNEEAWLAIEKRLLESWGERERKQAQK
jgi:2'-hydroxyisoflavone reductase